VARAGARERATARSRPDPDARSPPEEFIRIDLTPQQSFLLSRIDGRTGLGELLKICPIPAAEAEAAIAELVQAGHIRLYL
jgi:hypothetical protein